MPLDPERRHPQPTPSLVTGISWGCLRVVDGNAGTVSSFPARTTVARHDRFCLQVLAWLVRPCGFDACPSCVSSSWSTPPPGSQARVKPKACGPGEAGLDLSKEHLRTQELEQRGQLRIPSAFPSSGEGSGGGVRPLSRHHVGNRACVAARPGKKTPQPTPSLVTGISWGCLRVVDGNAGTVSSFPARTTVARHDRFCLQVLAWLVRPCGFDACPSCVSSSLVHAAPGSQARVKPKAQAPAKPA